MCFKQMLAIGQMQSDYSLRNPPGTVWHHPGDNPDVMRLLRVEELANLHIQPVLHPNGAGGYRKIYVP